MELWKARGCLLFLSGRAQTLRADKERAVLPEVGEADRLAAFGNQSGGVADRLFDGVSVVEQRVLQPAGVTADFIEAERLVGSHHLVRVKGQSLAQIMPPGARADFFKGAFQFFQPDR